MSNLKKTLPKTSCSLPKKLPEGTLVFIPRLGADKTVGIIINEPTSHFRTNSLEAFFVYDVFVASSRFPEYAQVMVVASTAIEESFEA